ncbi:MAG: YeeE/YedE family protein [Ectothiorhodospiraceae bacterium]|nr:YeeE/YedE family protein [Ectothiorhodospiraceae bacterium]
MSNMMMVAWGGFVIGLLFGIVGQRTGFCLTSGLRKAWTEGDGRMLRAFALAMAVAIIASHGLEAFGYVNLQDSIYIHRSFSWLLFLLGGTLFGYGMIMANGCGSRALVLLGSGNLRSLVVVLCIGIAGHMTLTGVLAPLRLWAAELSSVTIPLPRASLTGLAASWGLGSTLALWIPALLVASGLLAYCFSHGGCRSSPRHLIGGLVVGVLVAGGWYVTGYLGDDDFDPVSLNSLTFIAPLGDTIQYLMLSTGLSVRFGVTVVAGVVVGSLAATLASRSFQLQGFSSPVRMARYIAGGLIMGIGGALALGCSIGQGLSGMSTLALPTFIAVAGILLGAWLGLRGPLRLPPL